MNLINVLKSCGYRVFAPEKYTTYTYYTDGTRIGYAQVDRLCGLCIHTVHRPNSHVGTGYRVDDFMQPTKANFELGFAFAPAWAHPLDYKHVKKYDTLTAFLNAREKSIGKLWEY